MVLSPLLPKYHKDDDFFIAPMLDNLPVKDDMATMEHPFFTLQTQKDMRRLSYRNGEVSVDIVPSIEGLPSIFDKDILLYCSSLIMSEVNNGRIPPKTLRISIHDFLIATNKSSSIGGYAYERFKSGLERLKGCMIKTTVKTGCMAQVQGFSMIDSFQYIEGSRVKDRLVAVEITLSDWFYNSLIAKEVLTINKDYFRIRKALDRRIYEIARKHCGDQQRWQVRLDSLHQKTGSISHLRRFRFNMKQLAASNHLPDYILEYKEDIIIFTNRISERISRTPKKSLTELPQNIPPKVLEAARQAVGIGLDYYYIWDEFRAYNRGKEIKNLDAAFIGFSKKKMDHFVQNHRKESHINDVPLSNKHC